MRKYKRFIGSLWLSVALVGGTAGASVLTYELNKNDNLSHYTQKDLERIRDKIVNTYGFDIPGITHIKMVLDDVPAFNAYVFQPDEKTIEIHVFKGLLDFLHNEDELAYVIGHEYAHALLGHTRIDGVYEENTVNSEALADLVGQQVAKVAGYDPGYAGDAWERMGPGGGTSHPYNHDRVRILESGKFWYNETYEWLFKQGYNLTVFYHANPNKV